MSATEYQAEKAITRLRVMIEAAENSNQAGEDAVVAAAAGMETLDALKSLLPILEAVRYTAGLGKKQIERVEKAKRAVALAEGRAEALKSPMTMETAAALLGYPGASR